tara:strand:- start:12206 stop:14200 length:1995 start_codon:yes stop_codon:yes gene_type:complete
MSGVSELKKEYFKDTARLSPAANHFLKHGYYTNALPGTKTYYDYWDTEKQRCLYGYEAGGTKITGFHYFYLNYCRMERAVEETQPDGSILNRRENSFPSFYDGDFHYYNAIDKARRENKHMSVLKARRKGFSYKAASMLIRNYYFQRGSRGYVFASQKEYLIGDGLLSKAWDIMSFVDDNTAWTQPRLRDREMNKQSGYRKNVNGALVELGMKSQIIGVSLKDDPDKVRGKAGDLVFFEEAGSFPGLLKAWEVAMPTMRQGSKTLGTMIAFGTGGATGSDFHALEELFYSPDAYDCLSFENVWDEGAQGSYCGYFVPIYQNLEGFIDKDGNSDDSSAKVYEMEQRDKKKLAADTKTFDQYIAEHPMNPAEATLQITANLFDVSSLQAQYNNVKANNLTSRAIPGRLHYGKGEKIQFTPDYTLKPIFKFPHNKTDNNEGCVTMWEAPYKAKDGLTPHNLYIIGHDPYGQNRSADSTSLGSAYVIKRVNNVSQPDDIIVASYVGRPETQDEFNRNLFMLADYYNAKIGFENDRGEVIAYAKRHRKLHKLQPEFEMLDKKQLQSRKVKRSYGMHMTQARKQQGEIYIRDWLNSPRGVADNGKESLNLHKIYDPALLQELIKFNHKGNFDRVMSLMIAMYHSRELYNAEVKNIYEDRTTDSFFDRQFF